MSGNIDPTFDYADLLARELNQEWPAITNARHAGAEVRELIARSLAKENGPLSSQDVDVVVFGSLARGEWTSGSDVDWTLLVDGQASPDHRSLARSIQQAVAGTSFRGAPLVAPRGEGIFGNMAFSHEIIHNIGGQADTNRNTTQRLLLLLEARPIRLDGVETDLGPYERVIGQILYRYLQDDSNFYAVGAAESRIPRFLLNDIVRYWRTICVDFAYKGWEQAGQKWALRNVKLRMSRKLLFVSGLLTVFGCFRNDMLRPRSEAPSDFLPPIQDHLSRFAKTTPINILSWTLSQLGLQGDCGQLLDCYDRFLSELDDPSVRAHLGGLDATQVYADAKFLEFRALSHEFQDVLNRIFYERETLLREFIVQYGVF